MAIPGIATGGGGISGTETDNSMTSVGQDSIFNPDNSIVFNPRPTAMGNLTSNLPLILIGSAALFYVLKKGRI